MTFSVSRWSLVGSERARLVMWGGADMEAVE